GQITVTYDLVIAGHLEQISAHINGTITFIPDGQGGFTSSGLRDGYPWAEAYYHDGQGNVLTIFQRDAIDSNPNNLGAIELTPWQRWDITYLLRKMQAEWLPGFVPETDEWVTP